MDNDRVAVTHGRTLRGTGNGLTLIDVGIRSAQAILADSRLTRLIDFSVPAAMLAMPVLHFLPGEDSPQDILKGFCTRIPPGSYRTLSRADNDGADGRELAEIASACRDSSAPAVPGTSAAVETLFAGFDLIAPGLADTSQRRPDMPEPPVSIRFLAGAASKLPAKP